MFHIIGPFSGPTPPAGRRVLPPDTDFSLQQVSDILGRKSGGRKKGSAPTPPRRTVSAIKEQEESPDSELKSKMKLQKAKIESNTIPEYPFEANNFANTKDLSEFINAPRVPQLPPSQKTFQRADNSKDSAAAKGSEVRGAMEDSGISRGTGSSDSLKHLAIDKSKYMINTETATRSAADAKSPRMPQGKDPRTSGRKFSYPMIKQEYKVANESSGNRSVDIGTSTMEENVQLASTSFRGKQYPKVPLPLPQSASLRKKRIERPKLNMSHSVDAETEEVVTVGKLDVNNVTQTINRYGTIPKGVRIGEYLASMQSDAAAQQHRELSTVEDHDSGTDTASVNSCPALQLHANGLQLNAVGTSNASGGASGIAGSKGARGENEAGIQQESNVRPSAVVKSQSSHVIVDNPKAQYSGLQRQKSDLIPVTKLPLGEGRESPLHGEQKPKPSPRFSRFFLDQTENVLKLEDLDKHATHSERPISSPKLSQGQKGVKDLSHSQSSTESTLVSSPDSIFDSRLRGSIDHKVALRPAFQPKPRSASTTEEFVRESDLANQAGDSNASVLSKVAKFQPVGSEFSSFRPFQRGDGVRDSFKDDKTAKVPPDVPNKPRGQDDKPVVSGLKPVGAGTPTSSKPVDSFNNGDNAEDGNQKPVTKETIVSASDRLKLCIDSLSTAGNKSSVNFLELVEEMQCFYEMCSVFIDSLPPHAKFHTKELLSRLQSQQQNLKTFTSSTPTGGGKLLGDIQSVNKEIIDVIQR